MRLKIVIWAICIVLNVIFAQENCSSKEKALIVALLALHSGDKCEMIVQKGLQQIAALESTLGKINAENDVKIELKVFDTCSSIDQTVKSTLKATVFVDEECSEHYFFLGFLGPDDLESLRAVNNITNFFKYTHVVPRAIPDYGQFNVFNVAIDQPEDKAKSISLLLKELNWASFILIHTSDFAMSSTAARLAEFEDFCITTSILQIPSAISENKSNSAYNRLLHILPRVHDARVVVLADDPESVENFFKYVDGSVHGVKFVLYIQGSGIFPWKLSWDIAKNTMILHETTKSALMTDFQNSINQTRLWSSYLNQNKKILCSGDKETCKSFHLVVDSSILPLIYSLYIFSNALDSAYRNKCQKRGRKDGFTICNELMRLKSSDWREILENSKKFVKDETGTIHKIGFYMELDGFVDIFVYNGFDSFDKIGTISKERDLHLRYGQNSFITPTSKDHQCSSEQYEITTPTPEITTTNQPDTPPKPNDDYFLFGLPFPNDYFGYYKLVGTIAGFVTGVIIFIFLVIYFVYKSFKFKSRSDESDVSRAS